MRPRACKGAPWARAVPRRPPRAQRWGADPIPTADAQGEPTRPMCAVRLGLDADNYGDFFPFPARRKAAPGTPAKPGKAPGRCALARIRGRALAPRAANRPPKRARAPGPPRRAHSYRIHPLAAMIRCGINHGDECCEHYLHEGPWPFRGGAGAASVGARRTRADAAEDRHSAQGRGRQGQEACGLQDGKGPGGLRGAFGLLVGCRGQGRQGQGDKESLLPRQAQ